MATRIQATTIVLLLISIIVSGSALFYAVSLPGVSDSIDELRSTTAELASAEAGMASVLQDLGEVVGEYTEEILAIQERLASVEDLLKPPPVVQELIVAASVSPTHMDPAWGGHPLTTTAYACIYEGLGRRIGVAPVTPHLAESWDISEDATSITFKLKEGIKFHDGTPFNATAVKFSIERLVTLPGVLVGFFYTPYIDHVEVVDTYTAKLVLKIPTPWYVSQAASISILSPSSPLDEEGYATSGTAIGTGAWKFESWIPGHEVVVVRNDDYWGGKPELEKITFRAYPDESTRALALMAGDVNVILDPPVVTIPRFDEDPKYVVNETVSTKTGHVGLNCQWGPLTDVRVRQALNYAVDKESIVNIVLGGHAVVMDCPFAEPLFGYKKLTPYPYDPGKAEQLLADAGYPDGFTVDLLVNPGLGPKNEEVAEAVQGMLADVGVTVNIISVDYPTFYAMRMKPLEETDIEMWLWGGGAKGSFDAEQVTLDFDSRRWPPAGPYPLFYKNDRVDELIVLEQTNVDPDVREAAFHEMAELIWEDCPEIFMYVLTNVRVFRSNVVGLTFDQAGGMYIWPTTKIVSE